MRFKRPVQYLLLIFSVFFLFFALLWLFDFALRPIIPAPTPSYGVTFSRHYAKVLGLDEKEVFLQTLVELKAKKIRLPVYWSDIEQEEGKFDFTAYDRLLDMAGEKDARVILALGYKVPRWPECFVPSWGEVLGKETLQIKILKMIEESVVHFKDREEIMAWQIENEPLLEFGPCQIFGEQFLSKEVQLVRKLDSRPIIMTDSGELGLWVTALRFSDSMGTSLYRIVWNPVLGYFRYPFPPLYYNLKAKITKSLFAPKSAGVFISELQTEPWAPGKSLPEVPILDQIKLFPFSDFEEIINFTRWTRIPEQYLWGVEWWYYMKLKGQPEYWEYAKKLLIPSDPV